MRTIGILIGSAMLVAAFGSALNRDWSSDVVDVPLALAGLAIFAWLALRGGIASRHALALALLGVQSAIILDKLRVDFNRYYLPLILVAAIGVGLLAGQLWAWVSPVLGHAVATFKRRSLASPAVGRLQPASGATTQRRFSDG
jgi:hypothetical protein